MYRWRATHSRVSAFTSVSGGGIARSTRARDFFSYRREVADGAHGDAGVARACITDPRRFAGSRANLTAIPTPRSMNDPVSTLSLIVLFTALSGVLSALAAGIFLALGAQLAPRCCRTS